MEGYAEQFELVVALERVGVKPIPEPHECVRVCARDSHVQSMRHRGRRRQKYKKHAEGGALGQGSAEGRRSVGVRAHWRVSAFCVTIPYIGSKSCRTIS